MNDFLKEMIKCVDLFYFKIKKRLKNEPLLLKTIQRLDLDP